jgi:hypothetical protein
VASELIALLRPQPAILLVAVVVDLLIGDPVYPFHPIRLIGKLLTALESMLRAAGADGYAGGITLFVLLAVLFTWLNAAGEITASQKKVNDEVAAIKSKAPKGKGFEEKMEEQKKLLGGKVGQLWEANWKDQRDLIVWPKDGERGRLANFLLEPGLKTADGQAEFESLQNARPGDDCQSPGFPGCSGAHCAPGKWPAAPRRCCRRSR